ALGNKAFTSGDYKEAIKQFTLGIEADPTNHILYSNRSGAYSGDMDYEKALADAEKTIEIKPDWPKGYGRKGAALHGLGEYEEAKETYLKGLEVDPNNAQLKSSLEEVEKAIQNARNGDIVSKISSNPKLAPLLSQPDFMNKILDIQKNPKNISKYSDDPRILTLMMSLMGIDTEALKTGGPSGFGGDDVEMPDMSSNSEPAASKNAQQGKPEQAHEDDAMEVEKSESEKLKEEADAKKALGNAAYKKKQFDEALSYYDAAIEICPSEITYYTNKSAVYFEMGEYKKCIEVAEKAIEVGRESLADFKLVAKAFTRIGSAYHKLDDLDNAIKYYNKSLLEHRTADCLNRLKIAEKEKKVKEETAYLDENLANEARERGNQFFKEGKFPEAVKEYSESIKRNPKDPRTYSNRSASYTKLMALPQAMADVEKCLSLDPTFIKAYLRKAAIEFMKKDYAECLETCEKASELDTEKKHIHEIQQQIQRCYSAISDQNSGQSPEEIMKRAQQDPEIMKIMNDPGMQVILQQMQTDPRAIQEHLKNPQIARSIRKLMAAGIVRIG
ncbi:hypothetical protein BB560_005107, partial [Smittium megazygosporum]